MKVEPYLFFDGRCEEAVNFYHEALGAGAAQGRSEAGDLCDRPRPLYLRGRGRGDGHDGGADRAGPWRGRGALREGGLLGRLRPGHLHGVPGDGLRR